MNRQAAPGARVLAVEAPQAGRLLDYCLDQVAAAESVWPRHRSFLIVPETRKFRSERRYLERQSGTALLTAEVLSFPRLATRLLGEAGLALPERLGPREAILVIDRVIRRGGRERYPLFHRLLGGESFMGHLASLLDSFRRYGIDAAALGRAAALAPDEHGRLKLEEFAKLEADQQLALTELGLEPVTALLDRLAALLAELESGVSSSRARRLAWLRDASVWVTGFGETRSFTPQELEILGALGRIAARLTVTLVGAGGGSRASGATAATAPAWRGGAETLAALERVLPGLRREVLDTGTTAAALLPRDPVRLLYAESELAEAEAVAARIHAAVQAGRRYRDIAVCHARPAGLAQLARAFARFQIPAYIDDRPSLAEVSLARLLQQLIALAAGNWARSALVAALRSGLLLPPGQEALVDRLENHLIARGIDHGRIFHDPAYADEPELLALRQQRLDPLRPAVAVLGRATSGGAAGAALEQLLAASGLRDLLEARIGALQAAGQEAEAEALVRAWAILGDFLGRLRTGFACDVMDARRLGEHLDALYQVEAVGSLPSRMDEVIVSPVRRFDFLPVRQLFLLGASSANLPGSGVATSLLRDEEAALIEGEGGARLPGFAVSRQIQHAFWVEQLFRCPAERLTISLVGEPGDLATMLRARCQFLEVEESSVSDQIAAGDLRLVAPEIALRTGALQAALERPEPVANRSSVEPGAASGRVALLLGSPATLSVSRLESYAACPWQFFSGVLLGVDERERWQADPRLRGDLVHALLEALLAEVVGGAAAATAGAGDAAGAGAQLADRLAALEEGGLERLADRLIATDPRFAAYRAGGGFQTQRRSSIERVRAALPALFDELRSGEWRPAGLEQRFELELGAAGRLVGIIDRCDLAADGGSWRLIDYKTGAAEINWERMAAGLDLQLLTYADALSRKAEPGTELEAGYVLLPNPRESLPLRPEDPAAEAAKARKRLYNYQNLGLDGREMERAIRYNRGWLLRHAEGIRVGRYPVEPRRTSGRDLPCTWCPQRQACGIEVPQAESRRLSLLPPSEPGQRSRRRDRYISLLGGKEAGE
ncbi:MAG: PD-(D/E)XK nuclease family protein [Bacillota bacterium]|nr:PD-(D/E)XK nuclease family protein [Bacillota bacterium]